jgi:hypothetical protein
MTLLLPSKSFVLEAFSKEKPLENSLSKVSSLGLSSSIGEGHFGSRTWFE